jgi:hypothetical protein
MNGSSFASARRRRPGFETVGLLFAALTALLFVPTAVAQHPEPSISSAPDRPLPTRRAEESGGGATGVLKGRVLLQEGGRPLANVTVVVQTAGRAGSPVLVATDEDGGFQVSNLRPAAYVLTAVAPGYVSAPEDPSGQTAYHRIGESVTLRMVKGGVITGRVLNTNGDPLPAAYVRAIRVKDAGGQPAHDPAQSRARQTDDRGVYRLYGLEPGSYLVAVTNARRANIFYPSASPVDALPVQVAAGQEAGGIDIHLREERGYTVSGSVAGVAGAAAPREHVAAGVAVTLTHASTGVTLASSLVTSRDGSGDFALEGVPDGEYEIVARDGSQAASLPRRVTVGGADVRGVGLTLVPFGSVAGRVLLEAAPAVEEGRCIEDRRALLEETVIVAHARGAQADKQGAPPARGAAPDGEGRFVIGNLDAGEYFFETRLPSRNWYVRSAALPGPPTSPPFSLSVKQGARVEGFTITLAEGAASLRGRVVPGVEGAALPPNLRVYLVPAGRESADDPLRYAQAPVGAKGEFGFDHLAPGQYLAVALKSPAAGPGARSHSAAAEGDERARLRREAQTTKTAIELQPCRESADVVLRYTPRGPGTRPASREER